MQQEIGGYFQLEKLINKEYYSNLIALNSARNALLYVLKARKIKKIYLPYFLCNSVEEMCKRENYEYEFYHIGEDFLPIFNKELDVDEFLYIVNYYGQVNEQIIKQLHVQYRNIIIDNVQAFLHSDKKGVFDSLWIAEEIKDNIVENDLWIESGETVGGFSAANEAIGTLVIYSEREDILKNIMSTPNKYIQVKLKED